MVNHKIYEFTLNIEHQILDDEDLLNVSTAMYDGLCNDAFIGSVDQLLYAEFERQAETLEQAIVKAIHDIENTKGYELTVISVEGDLVSLGEAAEFTGVSKSTLSKYKKGVFGGGNFPSPIRKTCKKDPLWRLSDIALWLQGKGKISKDLVEFAMTLDVINFNLEKRHMLTSQRYDHICINI